LIGFVLLKTTTIQPNTKYKFSTSLVNILIQCTTIRLHYIEHIDALNMHWPYISARIVCKPFYIIKQWNTLPLVWLTAKYNHFYTFNIAEKDFVENEWHTFWHCLFMVCLDEFHKLNILMTCYVLSSWLSGIIVLFVMSSTH